MLINGELKGYFYGKRGLRKEGPLTPYLFLLVMEAFTALFQKKSEDDGFIFHLRCSSLSLSYLIFADDLFILCGAEAQSL